MKRNFLILAVFSLFCIGASSCRHLPIDPIDPGDTTYHPIIHPLAGTSWQLAGISDHGGRMQHPVNEVFTLKFDKQNGVGGQAACNTYGGNVRVDKENISFSNIMSTEAACGEMSLDRIYFQALNSAQSYTYDFQSLVIFTASGINLYFHDATSTPPPPPFGGVVHFTDFQVVDFHIDPFHVTALKKIDETHISATVQFSGGCVEHEFNLFANENIQPGNATDFVQMMITHDAHGDMCNAYLTKELVFDIAPLLKKWRSNPHCNAQLALQFSQSNVGTIIFHK